jgi:phage-related protein
MARVTLNAIIDADTKKFDSAIKSAQAGLLTLGKATALGDVAIGAAAATTQLLGMGNQIVEAGAALGALSFAGVLVGAQAFGVLKLALASNDAGVKQLKDSWQGINNDLTKASTSVLPGLNAGLKSASSLVPVLTDGLGKTGVALGGLARAAGLAVSSPLFKRDIATIMDANVTSMLNFGSAGITLLGPLRDIATVAAQVLAELSEGAPAWAQNVASMVAAKRASGELAADFRRGAQALKDLFSAVWSFGGIVKNVMEAANKASGDTLGKLADWLKKIKLATDEGTPAFEKMVEVFKKINEAGSKLFEVFKNVASDLSKLDIESIANAFLKLTSSAVALTPIIVILVNAFAGLIEHTPTPVIMGLTAAFVAVKVAMLAWNLWGTISMLIEMTVACFALGGSLSVVAGAIWAIVWPIGLVVLAIAAVIAIIIVLYKNWDTIWNGIKAIASAVWNWMQSAWDTLWNGIKAVASAVWGWLQSAWDAVVKFFLAIWENTGLKEVWETAWNTIKIVADAIWQAIQIAWETFINVLSTVWETVSGVIVAAWNAVWTIIKTVAEGIWNAIQLVWETFINILKSVWDIFAGIFMADWDRVWQGIKGIAEAIWGLLSGAWQILWDTFKGIWEAFSGYFVEVWGIVWNGIKAIVDAIWQGMQDAWDLFLNTIKAVWDTVSAGLSEAWSVFWGTIASIASTIWQGMQAAWDAICNAFINVWNVVSSALIAAWNAVWNAMSVVVQTIWNTLQTAWQNWGNTIQAIWNAVGGALSAAWSAVWNAISAIAQAVWNALQAAWNAFIVGLQTIWNSVSSALSSAWSSVWNTIRTVAETIWNALQTAWNTFLNTVQTIWNTVSNAIQSAWTTFWNTVRTIAETVWNAVRDTINAVWETIKNIWNSAIEWVKNIWNAGWEAYKNIAVTAFNWIKDTINSVWETIKSGWNAAIEFIKGIWNTFWETIKNVASTAWNWVRDRFNEFKNGLQLAFQELKDGIGRVWDGIKEVVKKPVKWVIDIVYNNALKPMVNKVLEWVGIDFRLPDVNIEANGGITKGAGNPDVVAADGFLPKQATIQPGKGKGLFQWAEAETGGEAFIPLAPGKRKRSTELLGKVASIFGMGLTGGGNCGGKCGGACGPCSSKKMANGGVVGGLGSPNFVIKAENGLSPAEIQAAVSAAANQLQDPVGGAIGGAANAVVGTGAAIAGTGLAGLSSITSSLADLTSGVPLVGDALAGIAELLGQGASGLLGVAIDRVKEALEGIPSAGGWSDALKIMPIKLLEHIKDKVKKKEEEMAASGGGVGITQPVQAWAPVALQALALAGMGADQLGCLLSRMQKESGGNSGIVNTTDSNAAAGVPSQGLMQVIPPTFAANCAPLCARGILDPLANIYAASIYVKRHPKYGTWCAADAQPDGYSHGGFHNFDAPRGAMIAGAGRGPLVQWAEPETGGEAYIPMGVGKRKRSISVLSDVAKQFGMGLIATKPWTGTGGRQLASMANGGIIGRGHISNATCGINYNNGDGSNLTISMPITINGNLDEKAVRKLEQETIPKMRMMLQQKVGRRP